MIIGFECEPIHMVLLLFWTEKDLKELSLFDLGYGLLPCLSRSATRVIIVVVQDLGL